MNAIFNIPAAVLTVLLLSGCNDSGDQSDSRRHVAGIWIGGFSSAARGPAGGELGIVAEDGRAVFINGPVYYTGELSRGRLFSGVLTAYSQTAQRFLDGNAVTTLTASGEASPGVQMIGHYNGVGDQGQFALNYNPSLYERAASLTKVSANWEYIDGDNTLTFAIDANGLISGADGFNCIYNGNISVINSLYNAYGVAFTISSCSMLDGNYEGLAFLSDQFAVDDILVVTGADGRIALAFQFRRT